MTKRTETSWNVFNWLATIYENGWCQSDWDISETEFKWKGAFICSWIWKQLCEIMELSVDSNRKMQLNKNWHMWNAPSVERYHCICSKCYYKLLKYFIYFNSSSILSFRWDVRIICRFILLFQNMFWNCFWFNSIFFCYSVQSCWIFIVCLNSLTLTFKTFIWISTIKSLNCWLFYFF